MAKLIAQPLQLEEVANYYNDSEASLRLYFSQKNRLSNRTKVLILKVFLKQYFKGKKYKKT